MNNTLLPGYDRPVATARVIDRELLKIAQQSARRRNNWQCANDLLRLAYGCEKYMNTKRTQAVLLRNGDKIVEVDGLLTISNFKMELQEGIVTFTATKTDGTFSMRWADLKSYLDRVV